ncbi:hypothetical protein AMTRI_Chr03g141640 [Amborella trichopoda]|nr:uncharacterized protein LOC18430460 isoform X1 [Amborella trichopoda]|eukprot:XP_020520703.1 uncharacterized protein LOC18430460 isoform X1 [Amborella trichopoda]
MITMNYSTASLKAAWTPVLKEETATLGYWLHWQVYVCVIMILFVMAISAYIIWKYEDFSASECIGSELRPQSLHSLYEDESWRPCLKEIHPAWLMAYRMCSFIVMLAVLTTNAIFDGIEIFYFYTQWTFALVTIYFGIGSLLSMYGCYRYLNRVAGDRDNLQKLDTEQGTYVAPTLEETTNVRTSKRYTFQGDQYDRQKAGIYGYIFQIVYQTTAGAVIFTDCVFWFIIVPFLTNKDYNVRPILIGMHSINFVLLLVDTFLNSLRFPWFRISYFILWTATFVIFQWVLHACVSLWWPYDFLDLSTPFAPLWYFLLTVMHLPCYALFYYMVRLKKFLLLRWFPQSYQCAV